MKWQIILMIAGVIVMSGIILADLINYAPPTVKINSSSFWYTTCADNQSINYYKDAKIQTEIKNLDGSISDYNITGIYEEKVMTYDAFPKCVKFNDSLKKYYEYVDIGCIMKSCKELIQYNIITGANKTIWKDGIYTSE